jgi:mannose-6-phosphate isomerase class I
VIEEEWPDGKRIKLPTHEEHFYSVHRYEFTGSVQTNTNNQCHICMLVEGKSITVKTKEHTTIFHYAETFVIPAATGDYEVIANSNEKAFLVVAQIKEEQC